MKRYDVIVVGAGAGGSTAASRLAEAGASVLLADKARFPRDKPCGGGLTMRAVRNCPIDPTPVVEDRVDVAEVREGATVQIAPNNTVTVDGERLAADVVVGADGANGTTARAYGLAEGIR